MTDSKEDVCVDDEGFRFVDLPLSRVGMLDLSYVYVVFDDSDTPENRTYGKPAFIRYYLND